MFEETKEKEENSENEIQMRYIKLPYIGEFSKTAKIKIKKLLLKFCKENTNVRLIFTTYKISSYFSTKDVMPNLFKSNVVYKFSCAGCTSCYVGRTHVYFNERRYEHLNTDKASGIFKHLKSNPNCKNVNNNDSFSILDNANTKYELALKEAMHIKWEKPDLNGQKVHAIIRLLI